MNIQRAMHGIASTAITTGDLSMPQQKGAKRAVKVQERAKKIQLRKKAAAFRRLEREEELAEQAAKGGKKST